MGDSFPEDNPPQQDTLLNSTPFNVRDCGSCMYYQPKLDERGRERRYGVCRFHAPTAMGFPWVYHDDWCAEGR